MSLVVLRKFGSDLSAPMMFFLASNWLLQLKLLSLACITQTWAGYNLPYCDFDTPCLTHTDIYVFLCIKSTVSTGQQFCVCFCVELDYKFIHLIYLCPNLDLPRVRGFTGQRLITLWLRPIFYMSCNRLMTKPNFDRNHFAFQSTQNTQKQVNLVRLHEQSKKNLEQEIQNYKDEAQKQRKIIYQLEKERDRYINEASDLTQKVSCGISCSVCTFPIN